MFKFRGPVIISEVYDVSYRNRDYDMQNEYINIPVKESRSRGSKQDALNDFLDLRTIVTEQIKNIKDPNTEI